MKLTGRTALVTGASSGIGEAFARELAACGADLVLTARRTDRLSALASDLSQRHGVRVDPLTLDLSQPGAAAALYERTEGAGRRIDILINNAGFGSRGLFVELPLERVLCALQLNLMSLTELTHRFGRCMQERRQGHILNVSSIGAYVPAPYLASYSAGKTYVRDFTEAVAYELAQSGVRVCCLCPGMVHTEFHEVAQQEVNWLVKRTGMSAQGCAHIGLSALFSWRRNVVAGMVNKLAAFLTRFVPRRLLVMLSDLVMR